VPTKHAYLEVIEWVTIRPASAEAGLEAGLVVQQRGLRPHTEDVAHRECVLSEKAWEDGLCGDSKRERENTH